jgi:hypothetical protein
VKGKLLTQYSSHANTIADTFRAAFAKSKVGEHLVDMTAPTDSTKGGLLALQHVTLKPETGMALVVGTVNAGEKHAEIRSYAHVTKLNEERFHRPLPFDDAAYAAFIEKATSVLGAFGIATTVTDAPRDTTPSLNEPPRAVAKPPSKVLPIVLAIVFLLVAAAAATFILRR